MHSFPRFPVHENVNTGVVPFQDDLGRIFGPWCLPSGSNSVPVLLDRFLSSGRVVLPWRLSTRSSDCGFQCFSMPNSVCRQALSVAGSVRSEFSVLERERVTKLSENS